MPYQPILCDSAVPCPPRRRAILRTLRPGAALVLAAATAFAAAPLDAAAGAATARGPALQAWDGGRTVTAVAAGDALRVEVGAPGAATVEVAETALPEGAEAWAAAVLADGWAVAGSRPAGAGVKRLFFTVGDAAGVRALPDPAAQRSPIRQDPVLLVDGGRLVGAAWLEGDDSVSLGVRAAAWDGQRWSPPERVAWPAPGSQLGLAGAVLDDGSWLLVWSAYDGTDHELVYAQRLGGGWLPAGRVSAENSVPDALPALTATAGGGALVAWNRFDGSEYRLRTARFDSGEWVDEAWAAPPGSIFPSFAGGREHPWLIYRDARAGGWAMAEVGARGGTIGAPRVVGEKPAERPAVVLGGSEPVLVWPAAAGERALRVEMRSSGPVGAGGGQP